MKIVNRYLYRSLICGLLLCGASACSEDVLVFPEQVATDGGAGGTDRGPVKQNNLTVITEDDERIKFDFQKVDLERVKSLVFSVNQDGEAVETEITDFSSPFVISNLPLRVLSTIEVWAVGHNNLLSEKYSYKVTARPYPATVVSGNVSVKSEVLSANLTVFNLTSANAVLYYKVDDASSYSTFEVQTPNTELSLELGTLTKGLHTLTYYATDDKGGESPVMTLDFTVLDLSLIDRLALSAEVSSVEIHEGADNGKGSSLIDGNINTFWHSTWSSAGFVYPHWILLDLGEERSFAGLEMIRRHNNASGGFKTFTVEYSNDKKSWTTLAERQTFNSADSPAAFQKYVFKVVQARYVRLQIIEPFTAGSTSTHLAEINVFEAK